MIYGIILFMQVQRQQPTITITSDPNQITLTHDHPVQQKIEKPQNKEQKKVQTPPPQLPSQPQKKDVSEEPSPYLQEYNKYFKNIKSRRKCAGQAEALSNIAQQSISLGIKTGQIQIDEHEDNLDNIIMQSRIRAEQAKIDDYHARKKLIDAQLQYLNSQVSIGRNKSVQNEQEAELIRNYTAVLSKKQHQQFLQKIAHQRAQLEAKKKKIQEIQKQKQIEEQNKRIMAEKEKILRQREEKKKKLMEKRQEHRIQQQKKLKQQEQNNKRLAEIKQKKRLHQVIEQKYQTQVLIPSLQEKKRKLKEIRQMSKAFNITDINNHEEEYLKKREHSLQTSIARVKHEEWNYVKPQKSERLAKILQKQKLQEKLRLEEKKRKIEQKIQRKQQYISSLKQRSPPKIDQKKRQEIEKRKQRLMSEQKQKVSQVDRKALGINYLQEIKKQRKKAANSQLLFKHKQEVQEQSRSTKKAITNYLDSRRSKRQYNEIREKRIDKLINSGTTQKFDKINQLQKEANKISQEQKRKQQKIKFKGRSQNFDEDEAESVGLLLASIKAKMGIIDVYNKQ